MTGYVSAVALFLTVFVKGIDESSFKYVLKYVFAKYVFTLQLTYPYLT